MKPTKQIILVRDDLDTGLASLASMVRFVSFNALYAEMPTAYGAEGYIASTLDYQEGSALAEWLDNGQALEIICVDNELELLNLTDALSKFTPYCFTMKDSRSALCSAIGPVFDQDVNHLTKDLGGV